MTDDRQKLAEVSRPPASTIAALDDDRASVSDRYAITFVPFGMGPVLGGGKGLVVAVGQCAPIHAEGEPQDFTGRNLVVGTSLLAPSQAIGTGGTYSGTLGFTEAGGALVPQLIEVKGRGGSGLQQ